MSMIEDDLGKQIDRSVVTKTTLLDIAMNSTHDAQEFNEMLHEYCTILYGYDLWEKPFIAMLIAAPMAVPWVGAILVLMPFRNNLAEAASPVMGICM